MDPSVHLNDPFGLELHPNQTQERGEPPQPLRPHRAAQAGPARRHSFGCHHALAASKAAPCAADDARAGRDCGPGEWRHPAPPPADPGRFGRDCPAARKTPSRTAGSWTVRLHSTSLADQLGFLRNPQDDLVRGLAGRTLDFELDGAPGAAATKAPGTARQAVLV